MWLGGISSSFKPLYYSTLADKSGGIVDFRGNTSSNRACMWSRHVFLQLFPTTEQSHTFTKPPRTSPVAASGVTKIKINVIRFVCQCTASALQFKAILSSYSANFPVLQSFVLCMVNSAHFEQSCKQSSRSSAFGRHGRHPS